MVDTLLDRMGAKTNLQSHKTICTLISKVFVSMFCWMRGKKMSVSVALRVCAA